MGLQWACEHGVQCKSSMICWFVDNWIKTKEWYKWIISTYLDYGFVYIPSISVWALLLVSIITGFFFFCLILADVIVICLTTFGQRWDRILVSLISNGVKYFVFICHLYLIFEEFSVYFFRLFIESISWYLVKIYQKYLDFV